ncbi:MAG TPA: hypothetical protein VF200_13315 [Woeseiaceae bacterium]
MLVSLEHRFAFLCNRKCASTSIETMLRAYGDVRIVRPPGLRHLDFRTYEAHVLPLIEATVGPADLETICVVREPLSWLYSFYRFRSRFALRNPSNPDSARSTADVDFALFLESAMQPEPPGYARIGSQFDFVRTADGEVGIDRIFLHEHLDEAVDYLGAKVGRSLHLGYQNISPKKNRKSRGAALVDRAVKTLTARLELRAVAERPAPPPGLPEKLLTRVREFWYADFALYEQALRAHRDATPGLAGPPGSARAGDGALHADR